MHALRRPSHGADAHHRAPSFSVRDFEQLLTSAFDLPSPTLVLTPASPPAAGPKSAVSTIGRSYFDDSADENHTRFRDMRRQSERPRSQSFSAFNFRGILPSSASTSGEPSSRPGITKRVLKSLRTRASALVLRPSSTIQQGPINDRDTRASVATLTPRTSTSASTARPPSQYSTASHSPRFSFPSSDENTPPSTLRGLPSPDMELDVKVSVTRHRSSSLPLGILKIPQQSSRDGPRSAHTPLPRNPRSKSPAPTLLGDLISARRNTSSSFSSSRARTPSQPSLPSSPLRPHTRLPPLSKSRSFNLLSGHSRKRTRANSMVDPVLPSLTGASSMAIEFADGELPAWCPEPYTNPRPPPLPPTPTSPLSACQELWPREDSERPADVPPHAFDRRGSSASIRSATTGKSTTLADRISQAIPRSLKMNKFRSRSKLNLSVITSSSNESTPSSFDTTTTFSSGAGSMPPTPHSHSFFGASSSRRTSVESEAESMVVDRVLTPEDDPFAKGDIEVPRSRTPGPFEMSESPSPSPKKAHLDKKARSRTIRKKSSGSGHSHTNSGDTITPLTGGLDNRPYSPMEVDSPEMERRPFVFPTPEMTMSSLSPSPSPTPYSEWSPIGLRQNAALPNMRDFPAHIIPLPSSPTPSRRSFGSPIPPSPGPPPNIPLPPSPTPYRVEFLPPTPTSPRLRKRKSQNSLRVAALLTTDRPPSPFPMATSAVSSASSLLEPTGPAISDDVFVSELDCQDDDCMDDMPSRGNGGWVRGPRFALAAEPTKPVWPMPPQGFGPPRQVLESSPGQEAKQLPALSPEFSALGFSVDSRPFPPSPTRSNTRPSPSVRPSHSDSALRSRSKTDASKHTRAFSHQSRSRGVNSALTLSEIEERWEGDTSRSTAFYSARSSMLSNISSVVGTGEAL